MTNTPRTDALFARHCKESSQCMAHQLRDLAVRQVRELLDHARTLEAENAQLKSLLNEINKTCVLYRCEPNLDAKVCNLLAQLEKVKS